MILGLYTCLRMAAVVFGISSATYAQQHASALQQHAAVANVHDWLWILPSWAKQNILGIEGITLWQIAALALFVLLGMLIRVMVTSVVVSRVEYILSRFSSLNWGQDLLASAAMPLGNLAMAGFLAFFIPSLTLNVHLAQWMLMAVRVLAAVSCVMVLCTTAWPTIESRLSIVRTRNTSGVSRTMSSQK